MQRLSSKQKILKVLEHIKNRSDISPPNVVIKYYAGETINELSTDEEIRILNKLADEKIIKVVGNFGSDSI